MGTQTVCRDQVSPQTPLPVPGASFTGPVGRADGGQAPGYLPLCFDCLEIYDFSLRFNNHFAYM